MAGTESSLDECPPEVIKSVRTERGESEADFVRLTNGRLLGINRDFLAAVPSRKAFYEYIKNGCFDDFPAFSFPLFGKQNTQGGKSGAYIDKVFNDGGMDIIQLTSGLVVGIEKTQLYQYTTISVRLATTEGLYWGEVLDWFEWTSSRRCR